jgi:hypothetical protein
MGKTKENNLEIQKSNQNELRNLEQFYTQGKVDTMLTTIQERKEQLVEDMIKYADEHREAVKWDKDGCVLAKEVQINPLVISNYFFKPIIPISSQEPLYNAEKLGMVFDYYCELLYEVNDKIGNFPSSLTLFCKFAGITLNTLRRWKNSDDYSMRVVVEKIYDQIGDENITMSQMGVVREKSTIFKMKSQNEITEKVQPNVNISVKTVDVDLDRINERLKQYSNFSNKKGK